MRAPADNTFGDLRTRIALLRAAVAGLDRNSGTSVAVRDFLSSAEEAQALAERAVAGAEEALSVRSPVIRTK